VWVTKLNHITCKYMFSVHSLACYFLSNIAFKLSTFYVFTFFYGLSVVSVVHALILYFSAWNTIVFCKRLKMRLFFVPWVYTPSSSGFICIWPVWSFIFTSLKLTFPSLLSGSVPLNDSLGLLYEFKRKACVETLFICDSIDN